MDSSILTDVKKVCGIDESYEHFDLDIMMHINSAISTLTQLGVGPSIGFAIEDKSAKWSDFLGSNIRLNSAKTYICIKVKLVFDAPQSPRAVESLEQQARELEWRLNVERESTEYVDPTPVDPAAFEDPFGRPIVLDGGTG